MEIAWSHPIAASFNCSTVVALIDILGALQITSVDRVTGPPGSASSWHYEIEA